MNPKSIWVEVLLLEIVARLVAGLTSWKPCCRAWSLTTSGLQGAQFIFLRKRLSITLGSLHKTLYWFVRKIAEILARLAMRRDKKYRVSKHRFNRECKHYGSQLKLPMGQVETKTLVFALSSAP